MPIRVADGRRQFGANCLLAGLDTNLSPHANCGFRPAYLYYQGTDFPGGPAFPAVAAARSGAEDPGGNPGTGLGVCAPSAEPDLGDPDSRRACPQAGGQVQVG